MFGGSGFSVGVDLMLASNADKVLGLLGSELTGVETKAGRLRSELGLVKSAFVGAFAIGAAKELVSVMDEMIKKGADLEQTLYRISTAGYSKADIDAFRKNATKVAGQFRNVTEKEMLKLTLETSAVYGDPHVAMKFLPISAAYIAAEKARHPENPEAAAAMAEEAIFKVLRSEEMRGLAQDPREVKRGLAASLKGQEVFGDQFDPSIGFMFMKYARLAGRYMSDRFLNGPGLIVAQEIGGSNAGNSHNMIMQALVGGHASKAAVEEMMRVNMIDAHKVKKVGGKNWHYDISDAVPDVRLLQSDFDLWAQRHIRGPIDAFTNGDLGKRDQELRKIFGRTTQQQYAELMAWQTGPGGRFAKDIGLLNQALTPEQAVAAAGDNLATAGQALATQIDRVATNVGDVGARLQGHVAKAALPVLSGFADRTGTDQRLDVGLFGGAAAGVIGLSGLAAWSAWPLARRLWQFLHPPKGQGGPDEPGAPTEGPGRGGAGGGGGGGSGTARVRPTRAPTSADLPPKLRPRGPLPNLPEELRPRGEELSDIPEVRATAHLRQPTSPSLSEEEQATTRLRPKASQAPQRPRVRPLGGLPAESAPDMRLRASRPPLARSGAIRPGVPRPRPSGAALGPRPRPQPRAVRTDPFSLRPPGTEHLEPRAGFLAGAGKVAGAGVEAAAGKVGLLGKGLGLLAGAPIGELLMIPGLIGDMKHNWDTNGRAALAYFTGDHRTHDAIISADRRRRTPDLRMRSVTLPDDEKARVAFGTTLKAMNDLGVSTAAVVKEQVAMGKATRDLTSALIAMMQRAQTIQVSSYTMLDGRVMAKTVTQHQVHETSGPRARHGQSFSTHLPAITAPYVPG